MTSVAIWNCELTNSRVPFAWLATMLIRRSLSTKCARASGSTSAAAHVGVPAAHLVGVAVITRRMFEASNSIAARGRSQRHARSPRKNFRLDLGWGIDIELNSISNPKMTTTIKTRERLVRAAQEELIRSHGHLEMQPVAKRAKVSV